MTFRTIQQQVLHSEAGMTDSTALLQSILSDPADDHRRLLYADHLDECGEGKRAEFVRVQVELERPIGQSFVDVEEILELRRRERELLLHRPWPQWFALPKNQEGYFLNGFGFETQNQQGIGITTQRGFIASIRLSWSDWLRHHEAMYWHPKQTVECRGCGVIQKYDRDDSTGRIVRELVKACKFCKGAKRIPRPFVTTAHPITRVELTTWPRERDFQHIYERITLDDGIRFDRVKCAACGGEGGWDDPDGPKGREHWITCPKCHGQPLNEWHCDQWPTITFVMPDSR